LRSARILSSILNYQCSVAAEVLPAALFLMMGNVGCDATAEVAILTIASLFGGCASSGPIVNSVDLAPNFSGAV